MSRWISQNLSLFLLALLLAFFFWAVATESEDPTQVRTFTTPIPVEIRDLNEDMAAYGAENTRVRVEIRAPRSVWENLRAEDIHAYIDLSDAPTGTVEVPVQIGLGVSPASITNITPQAVEVTVERIAEKEVAVTTRVEGTPALGYLVRETEIAPTVIRVRGPETQVSGVTEARIDISIEGRQSDLRSDYVPRLINENGNTVADLEIVPSSVTVHVAIAQWLNTRDVPVNPTLVGQPAFGYRIANIEIEPQLVTVWGRSDLLNTNATLQTEPIDYEGITQTLQTSVTLRLPAGLQLLTGRPDVTVTLTVEAIRSGLTLEITPTVKGLQPNLEADIEVDYIIVILSGPISAMEQLSEDDVKVVLDLNGLRPGDYSLIPQITVPNEITIENTFPEKVPVKIEVAQQTEESFE
jgi:YbbR domain-containing protein